MDLLQNHAYYSRDRNGYSGFPQHGKNVNTLYINKKNENYRDIEYGNTIQYEYQKTGNKYNIRKAMDFEKIIKNNYDNKVKILVYDRSHDNVTIIDCEYITWTKELDGKYYLIFNKI